MIRTVGTKDCFAVFDLSHLVSAKLSAESPKILQQNYHIGDEQINLLLGINDRLNKKKLA